MNEKQTGSLQRKPANYKKLIGAHQELLHKKNITLDSSNGIYTRYKNPVITANHVPLEWKYDFNPKTNPYGLERIGINAAFNSGALKWKDKYILAVRVEGNDRKSFFVIAESPNGVGDFKFWDKPIVLPQTEEPDTNVYDMRLTEHEDGWIYGVFCTRGKIKANQKIQRLL